MNRPYHIEADPGAAPHVEANVLYTLDALDRITQVDLNPVRAGIATRLEDSAHTSILQRLKTLQADAVQQPLRPVIGLLAPCLPLSMGEYIELAEWTGKQLRPGKRGAIPADAPSVLSRTETKPERWTVRVQAIGSGYWRVVGEVEDLIERAARMQQRWLKGIGVARRLAKAD